MKIMPKLPPQKTMNLPKPKVNTSTLSPSQAVWTFLFFLVLIFAIGSRLYKAHYSGIMYDESLTFLSYCRDIHTAITSYTSTNNHVLNSVFICLAHNLFGSYEHFIRIPSALASIIFTLALAYIICKTLKSFALRTSCLAVISLGQYVFHYSFFARGYAFALAGIYLQIALVIFLLDHPIKFRYWPIPALVISLLNFLAFGAMLSSILTLCAFNLIYIFLYSPKIFVDIPGKCKTIVLSLISIVLITFSTVFPLYRHIFGGITQNKIYRGISRDWQGWTSFADCLKGLLGNWIFRPNDLLGMSILCAVLSLIVISLVFHFRGFCQAIKTGLAHKFYQMSNSITLLFTLTTLTIVIMFVYGVILNKSLGLLRNHVFLVPAVVICSVIILDRFTHNLKNKIFSSIIRTLFVILAIAITCRNLPPSYSLTEDGTSRALLNKLKAIDPDKTWNIAFSPRKKLRFMGYRYYRQFDYNFQIAQQGRWDVLLCHPDEIPDRALCLDYEYFRNADCAVVMNCALPDGKVVLSAQIKNN